ncbi:hypothetical protein SCUCBS95973_006723 [Sporothrix curviconia]|uniref:Meiotically up-regulated gene 154 protein n=1 Tax=Sporothrix curviconia TaxID=1260050 RepID=A0ABP0C7T9_9PEZI
MPRPRIVRKQPLMQRISAAINPLDFLLWLSEEIETRELDSTAVGSQVGVVANFLFLLARANLGPSNSGDDDVFGDGSGRGWLSYLIQLLVWAGVSLSVVNALFVYTRKRHYRLFEANIEQRPGTPSANRVRVQSSPSTNSPLRLINDLVHLDSAESRAHPDSTRDVWELAVWDPRPASLALLSFFSPLHVLIYLFELPLDPLEPRPSVAVFKCLVLQVGLSVAMRLMQARNDQRQRDNAIIQKEVLHEYNAKFVQPRLHPIVRDVGTQVTMVDHGVGASTADSAVDEAVEVGTTTTVIHRGFQTHPNANYLKHVDPDFASRGSSSALPASASTSTLTNRLSGSSTVAATSRHLTPAAQQKPARYSDSFTPVQGSAARPRQSMAPTTTPKHNHFASIAATGAGGADPRTGPRASTGPVFHTPLATTNNNNNNSARLSAIPSSATTNFGGSMGVYSHVNSPLKKAISMNDIGGYSPRNSREMAALEQREAVDRMQRRAASPTKSPHKENSSAQDAPRASFQPPQELSSPPVPVNPFAKTRPSAQNRFERFPKRW